MTDQTTQRTDTSVELRHRYGPAARAKASLRGGPLPLLERGGLVIVFAAMVIAFCVSRIGPLFRTSANIDNLLISGAVVGILALAMLPPLVAGHFDLSVAAIGTVSNIAVASALGKHGAPIVVGLFVGVAVGTIIGVVNGFLVARLKLNAFVVTFGMYILLQGLTNYYTHGAQILSGIPASLGAWSGKNLLGIPRPFLVLVAAAALLWFALSNLPWGRHLEAIGSNESAARLVGINVDRSIWLTFVVSGALSGVGGALLTSTLGAGDPGAGLSYLFPAFAAVFLGATTIRPGRYNVIGTVIGVYFVGTAVSGLSLFGAQTWVQPTFNGAALVLAVAISTFLSRARQRNDARVRRTPVTDGDTTPKSQLTAKKTARA